LASRELILSFDEVIDVSTFKSEGMRVQVSGSEKVGVALTDSAVKGTADTAKVVIGLSRADHVSLGEDSSIATSPNNTFLAMTSSSFDDIFGRNINALTLTKAQQASKVTPDATDPVLTSSTLDLTKGKLTLDFSEPVSKPSVQVDAVTLQSGANGSAAGTVTRNLSSTSFVVDADRDTITITLNDKDMNAMKIDDTFAVPSAHTYIAYTVSLVVDLANNAVTPAKATKATKVAKYVADSVAPTVVAFGINMDSGVLSMSFSEVVRANSINVSQFVLQNAAPSTASHRLTGGKPSTANGLDLTITLTVDDLNAIKGKDMTTSAKNTYIRVLGQAVQDMNKNVLAEMADNKAIAAKSFKDDFTRPKLVNFDLDLNKGEMLLVFSETVAVNSIDPKKGNFGLQSVRNASASKTVRFILTGGKPSAKDSTDVTISLSPDDINSIKALSGLAAGKSSTYLMLGNESVTDVSGNAVVPTLPAKFDTEPETKAVAVRRFDGDVTKPTLVAFGLSITTGKITLTFDETVNPSTINPKQMTIQSHKNRSSATFVTLSSTTKLNATYSTKVEFVASFADLNAIKQDTGLAVSEATTFLSCGAGVIDDMSSKPANGVSATAGMPVSQSAFAGDGVSPEVVSFLLDIDRMELNITMSEPVKSAITVSALTLTNGDQSSNYTLTKSSTAIRANGERLVSIKLSFADMNQLKYRTTLATGKASTMLLCTKDFAVDKNDNSVVPLTASDKKLASDFNQDQVRPTAVKFTYDQSTGKVTVTLSEAITSKKSFNPTAITFKSRKDSRRRAALQTFTFKGDGTIGFDPKNPHIVSYTPSDAEREAMKAKDALCTTATNCFITADNSLFKDSSSLTNVPVVGLAPVVLTPDAIAPVLDNFDLSMNAVDGAAATLILSFSETVQAAELDVQSLVFISCSNLTSCKGVTISSGNFSTAPATEIKIVIPDSVANKIKANAQLCTSAEDTYLQIKDGFVADMAGVKLVTPKVAKKVKKYTDDQTGPAVTAADLDMDAGRLVLKFSETVNASSIDVKEITILSGLTTKPDEFKLTGGSVASLDPDSVTITFLKLDLDAIKKLSSLAVSRDSSFISFTKSAIADMAGNQVTPVTQQKAARVDSYTPDNTRPQVIGYEIDMTKGTLRLKFSETVDADTIDPKSITLHDCAP